MKILIDGLSQVGAGNRTYLENILPRLAEQSEHYFDILWPQSKSIISSVSNRLHFIPLKIPIAPPLWRVLFEQSMMAISAYQYDAIYSPVNIGPVFSHAPVFLAIRNPNPFKIKLPYRSKSDMLKLQIKRLFIYLSAKNAHKIIFVSDYSRKEICRQFNIPISKTRVIYHGIDSERFSSVHKMELPDLIRNNIGKNPFFLYVSTLNEHKNHLTAVKAFAKLSTSLKQRYKLVFAGRIASRKYQEKVFNFALQHGIKSQVLFLGEVAYKYIPSLYHSASLYLFPSLSETFGHSLVEAMAAGVPIVASNSSCIPEIVTDAGITVDPLDDNALSGAISQVVTDKKLRESLVKKGYSRARYFSWDYTVRQLIETFNE